MQPPVFPTQTAKKPLWSRTPPALFTPVFGLFGLAVAWGRAVPVFGVPDGISQMLFGAVTLLYLFLVVAYGVKVVRRPGVVREDLTVLPGRAGLAAMTQAGMLMALGLMPMSRQAAMVVLVLSVAGHAVVAGLVIWGLVRGPKEARSVTPVWHLTFVGFIVSVLAAIPLGFLAYSFVVFVVTLIFALVIWGISIVQFARRDVPAPLRPLLAIHVAPMGVLGVVAMLIGFTYAALALGLIAIGFVALLLIRVRWLLEAGFSPLWGAFTFPLAAFASLLMLLGYAGFGEVFRILGGLVLVAATLILPVIAWKVIKMWAKGVLAVKTNAAEA